MEEHITEDINYAETAKIACCSSYHFQRMFAYLAGIPLSEYIRRRKMSLAAVDLQDAEEKVIDIALKYGYSSPTAFNRAFQSVHGFAPSLVKKNGISIKSFPPISFKITVQGVEGMNFRIEKKGAFRIVGVRDKLSSDVEECFKCVPEFWQRTHQDGLIPKIIDLMNAEPKGLLGVSTCNGENEDNYYFIAVSSDRPVPVKMFEFIVPENLWAIFPGSGTAGSIADLQKRIFSEWLPTSGYEWASAPDVEVYLNDDPKNMEYEVWLPIIKKE
jgi:AraC family transcriptional regulator